MSTELRRSEIPVPQEGNERISHTAVAWSGCLSRWSTEERTGPLEDGVESMQGHVPPFAVISGAQVERVLSGNEQQVTELIEAAYRAHGAGDTVNPPSYFLQLPNRPTARIIALPASINGETQVDGLKWISSFPENVAAGIPRASAPYCCSTTRTPDTRSRVLNPRSSAPPAQRPRRPWQRMSSPGATVARAESVSSASASSRGTSTRTSPPRAGCSTRSPCTTWSPSMPPGSAST